MIYKYWEFIIFGVTFNIVILNNKFRIQIYRGEK